MGPSGACERQYTGALGVSPRWGSAQPAPGHFAEAVRPRACALGYILSPPWGFRRRERVSIGGDRRALEPSEGSNLLRRRVDVVLLHQPLGQPHEGGLEIDRFFG